MKTGKGWTFHCSVGGKKVRSPWVKVTEKENEAGHSYSVTCFCPFEALFLIAGVRIFRVILQGSLWIRNPVLCWMLELQTKSHSVCVCVCTCMLRGRGWKVNKPPPLLFFNVQCLLHLVLSWSAALAHFFKNLNMYMIPTNQGSPVNVMISWHHIANYNYSGSAKALLTLRRKGKCFLVT